MPGWLNRITGQSRPEIRDAKRLYHALMRQSRMPEFYGAGRVPDSYDGRIDCLSLHMAIVMRRLNDFGDQGARLSQALYDVMIDDFDSALREEALADTGVSRRIKPIARLFFTRAKVYAESLDANEMTPVSMFDAGPIYEASDIFKASLTVYASNLAKLVKDRSLGEIAQLNFSFPSFADM